MTFAVGDHVRLKHSLANEHQSYQIANKQIAFMRESIDGLILSIRDISTGKLMSSTTGELTDYVIELLYDNTFSAKFASLKNAPRTAERPTAAPAWRRMQAILRDMAAKGELLSTSSPDFLQNSPLTKMLDGWKVIKVRSHEISTLEKPQPE